MSKKILVPLDGSNFSEAALKFAKGVCEPGDELTLVRVVPFEQDYMLLQTSMAHAINVDDRKAGLSGMPIKMGNRLYAEAEAYLALLAERLHKQGCEARAVVREGRCAQEILNESLGHDLIVMSTRANGGLTRAVLGSVASAVLNEATVPVLLIKPEPVDVFFGRQ